MANKAKGERWSRHEIVIVAFIFICFLGLRLYNLSEWAFANVDEVSTLNQMGLPLLSGGSASTTFLVTTVLMRIFLQFTGFPLIRIITVFIAALALVVFYSELRRHVQLPHRLITLAILTFSWYYVYITRLFEVGSFVAPMGLLTLAFILKHIRIKRTFWLYMAFIAFGIGLEFNATPFLYGGLLIGLYAFIELVSRRLKYRHLLGIGIITIMLVAPYMWTIAFKDPITKAPLWSYGFFGESGENQIFAINARHPMMALRSVAYFFFSTFSENQRVIFSILALLLLLMPLLLWFKQQGKTIRPLLIGYSLLLPLFALSTAPLYHQGQMHLVWLLWLLLVPALFSQFRVYAKYILALALIGLLIFQLAWLPAIFQNQVDFTASIFSKNKVFENNVYISDGVMLKLKYFKQIFKSSWPLFYCENQSMSETFSSMEPPFMVLLTSDCPQDNLCTNCYVKQLAEFDQVKEPFLKHGVHLLSVYR